MDKKETPREAYLRQRLKEGVDQLAGGSADKLGRMMGYTNGGFLREIINGRKPVRTAVIERMHQNVEGGAGWFDGGGVDLVVPGAGGQVTYAQVKVPSSTAGAAAAQLAIALGVLSGSRRKTISAIISELIEEGPAGSDALAMIDTLAPGVIVVPLAELEWRRVAYELAEKNEDQEERERIIAMLMKVDQVVKDRRA